MIVIIIRAAAESISTRIGRWVFGRRQIRVVQASPVEDTEYGRVKVVVGVETEIAVTSRPENTTIVMLADARLMLPETTANRRDVEEDMKISTRIIAALQLTPGIGIGCLPRVKIKAVRGAAAIGIMITIAEAGADGNRDQDRGRLIEDALILIIIAIALDDTEKNSGGADRDRDRATEADGGARARSHHTGGKSRKGIVAKTMMTMVMMKRVPTMALPVTE